MSVKNTLWIVGGLFLCAIAAGTALVISMRAPNAASVLNQIGLPVAGEVPGTGTTTAVTIVLPLKDGSTLTVNDFVHNGETVEDLNTPNSYILAGSLDYCLSDGTCPHGATSTEFTISYAAQTQTFNISLLKMPLSGARASAEQFLESRLGVVGQKLCEMHYFVGTSYQVSPAFAGKNLGFSFCAGAIVLP